jgi:hypothetical protein
VRIAGMVSTGLSQTPLAAGKMVGGFQDRPPAPIDQAPGRVSSLRHPAFL